MLKYLCAHKKSNVMKKVFLSALLVGFVSVLNAQTQKNDWMVGGNFRLNTADNNTQIAFTPNAGLFIIDNLAVGANFSLSYEKSGNNKYTAFGVGPFARYYFTTESQTIRPIVHGSFNYQSRKTTIANVSSTNNGINYFLGGGAAAFISPTVSIDALMGYDHTKYSNTDGNGGFAFNIGFQVYINKGIINKLKGK